MIASERVQSQQYILEESINAVLQMNSSLNFTFKEDPAEELINLISENPSLFKQQTYFQSYKDLEETLEKYYYNMCIFMLNNFCFESKFHNCTYLNKIKNFMRKAKLSNLNEIAINSGINKSRVDIQVITLMDKPLDICLQLVKDIKKGDGVEDKYSLLTKTMSLNNITPENLYMSDDQFKKLIKIAFIDLAENTYLQLQGDPSISNDELTKKISRLYSIAGFNFKHKHLKLKRTIIHQPIVKVSEVEEESILLNEIPEIKPEPHLVKKNIVIDDFNNEDNSVIDIIESKSVTNITSTAKPTKPVKSKPALSNVSKIKYTGKKTGYKLTREQKKDYIKIAKIIKLCREVTPETLKDFEVTLSKLLMNLRKKLADDLGIRLGEMQIKDEHRCKHLNTKSFPMYVTDMLEDFGFPYYQPIKQ